MIASLLVVGHAMRIETEHEASRSAADAVRMQPGAPGGFGQV